MCPCGNSRKDPSARGAEEFERQHGKTQEEKPEAPNVQLECPAEFGNTDIWGIALADPTP